MPIERFTECGCLTDTDRKMFVLGLSDRTEHYRKNIRNAEEYKEMFEDKGEHELARSQQERIDVWNKSIIEHELLIKEIKDMPICDIR